jgi:hypothetical protein
VPVPLDPDVDAPVEVEEVPASPLEGDPDELEHAGANAAKRLTTADARNPRPKNRFDMKDLR